MGNRLLPFERIGDMGEQKPYYPFPVAVERGILTEPEKMARPSEVPPGIALLAGRIPNSKFAGLVLGGGNNLAAFDHTAAEFHGKELMIMPAAKDSVSHEGLVQDEGMILMGTSEGRIKVAAFALNVARRPWLVESLRNRSFRVGTQVGDLAVVSARVLSMPEYEIDDIDGSSGIVRAFPRRDFY